MKSLIGLIKKEFFHIFRDVRTMIILFGMPIAQIILFGYVLTNELKEVNVAVLDYSKDVTSKEITNKIESSTYFNISAYIQSHNEIDELFRKNKVKEVIIFEPGFAQNIVRNGQANIQLIADATEPNTARLATNYTSAIINKYFAEKAMPGVSLPTTTPQIRMLYNEELKGAYLFVPGIMAVILMLISAMMTSITIAREKEAGTMEVLLASPLKSGQIILGKVIPYLFLSFLNAVLIIVMGNLIFHVPVEGSIVLLLSLSILFILLALSLGILISTMASNQMIAMMVSGFALMMPTLLLSGFIFPIENMPIPLQIFSHAIPARWYIIIVRAIMLKGVGLSYLLKPVAILIGMTIFFIGLSIKRFKTRLG